MIPTIERARQAAELVLPAFPSVRKAYLFGSTARGEAEEGSDYDVLLELSRCHSYDDVISTREALTAFLDCPADILSAPLEAMPHCVRDSIEKDRMVIYEAR